jgi:thiol-disulfide isomerase/thioredoxin
MKFTIVFNTGETPLKRLASFLPLILLAVALTFSSASAQTAEPQPTVHAVIFTNPVCTFCRQIVEKDLPPAIQRFGEQLEILSVDVNTPEGEALYEAALKAFNVPRGVPLLFIGQDTLGGVNIAPQFPNLVDTYLAQGGVDFPEIPGLDEYIALAHETDVQGQGPSISETVLTSISQNADQPIVHAVMFWMDGCPHCHDVLDYVLPPLQEKYGGQLDILLVEVATMQDIEMLYQVSAAYNIPKEQTFVPFLVIGETALVGADNIHARLPALIEQHLAQGGVELPDTLRSLITLPIPVSEKTIVYIFWGDGCPHCEAARPFLHELAQRYPGVEILEYEVWYEIENQALFTRMAAKLGFEPRSVPTIFIGERYWEGFSDGMKAELENAVAICAESGCPNAGLGIISDPAALPASLPEVSASTEMRDNGFALAIVIMIGMGIALLYSIVAFFSGKSLQLPALG